MTRFKKSKVVFLVSEDKFYIYDFILKISNNSYVDIKLIVIQEYNEKVKRKLILSILFGLWNCLNLSYELFFKRSSNSIVKLCKKKKIKFVFTNNLNETKVINKIKKQNVNLIINLNIMKILKKNFINKFKKKLVNFHPGILPNYRGLYSTFYKIINKDKYFGITSHQMRSNIDDGPIISIIKEKINGRNLYDCYKIIYTKMIYKLFKETLKKNIKNLIENKKSNSKIYKSPSLMQILKYKFL